MGREREAEIENDPERPSNRGTTEMGRNGTQGARRDMGCIVSRVTQGHKLGYVLARISLGSGKPTHG